jgi:hypothetical protein
MATELGQYGLGALQGAIGGAATGTSFAPGIGTAVGAGAGLVGGIIGTYLDIEAQEEREKALADASEKFEAAQRQYNQTVSQVSASAKEAVRQVATSKQAMDARKADQAEMEVKQQAAQAGLTPAEQIDSAANVKQRVAEASAASSPAVMQAAMAGANQAIQSGIQKAAMGLSISQDAYQFDIKQIVGQPPPSAAANIGGAIGSAGQIAGNLRGAGIDPMTGKPLPGYDPSESAFGKTALGGAGGQVGTSGALGKTAPGLTVGELETRLDPDYMPSWTDPGHPSYSARAAQNYAEQAKDPTWGALQPELSTPDAKRDTGLGRTLERGAASRGRAMQRDLLGARDQDIRDRELHRGIYAPAPAYASGGMAGQAGPELALLGEEGPELVLNAKQTQELAGALGARAYEEGGVAGNVPSGTSFTNAPLEWNKPGAPGAPGLSRISHMGAGITERQAGAGSGPPRQDKPAQPGGGVQQRQQAPLGGTAGIPARFLGPALQPEGGIQQREEQSPVNVQREEQQPVPPSSPGLPLSYEELSSYITQINWLLDQDEQVSSIGMRGAL